MENYVVDTSMYNQTEQSPYCSGCGSCGEFGCECWFRCSKLHCEYGDGLIEEYERLRQSVNEYYEMLDVLGIDPLEIDLERVKQIADRTHHVYIDDDKTIKDAVSFYFDLLKDEEDN